MAEVRNHLVEEVNQLGTRPPADCAHFPYPPGGLQLAHPRARLVLASALIRLLAAALKILRRKKNSVVHGNYSHTLLKLFSGKKYVQKNATYFFSLHFCYNTYIFRCTGHFL